MGIVGERLAGDTICGALLGNTFAAGTGLVALILTFDPISGAHVKPAVTPDDVYFDHLRRLHTEMYVGAEIASTFSGITATQAMFAALQP